MNFMASEERPIVIFAPAHVLKSPGHWAWAFYDFALENGAVTGQCYRFESDLRVLTPENRVVFIGLTRGCARWIEQYGDRSTVILLPGTSAEQMEKYRDSLCHAQFVVLVGEGPNCPELPNLVKYPGVRGLSPVRMDTLVQMSSGQAPGAKAPEEVALLAPSSYMTVWEYLIAN
jgi:hypothetical protein